MEMTINVASFDFDVSSSKDFYPIPYNFQIHQKSGTFTVSQMVKLMPGANLHIYENAKLNVTSKLAVMDSFSDHGDVSRPTSTSTVYANYRYPTGDVLKLAPFSGNGTANLIVDGTMTVAEGGAFGGVVQTNGSGRVTMSGTAGVQVKLGTASVVSVAATTANISGRTVYDLSPRLYVTGENETLTMEKGKTYVAIDNAPHTIPTFDFVLYTSAADASATETITGRALNANVIGTWKCETCTDENNDHKCDVCGITLSECADSEDADTLCDICGVNLCKHGDVTHTGAKAPTCTEIGWDAYETCSRCDYTTYVEIPAKGHAYEGKVTTAPTCTEKGVKTYTCKNDASHTYTEEVAATGHTLTQVEAKAATCEEIGWNAYEECSVCDYTTYVEIPVKGHAYEGEVTTAPTCTEKGVKTYTCKNDASHTYTEEIAAKGHTDGEVVVENNVDPTCTTEGSYDNVVYCTECNAELSRNTVTVDKIAHAYEAVVTAPTCTAKGYTTYTCTACGDSYVADETEMVDHTEGEVVVENKTDATCTAEGSYDNVVYCTECKEELSRETVTVDKLAHTPAEAVEENRVESTCKVAGSYDSVVYCSVCKTHEISRTKVDLELAEHTPGEVVKENEVAATCTAEGSYDNVVYCTVCDEELSRDTVTIDKIAHTPATAVEEKRVESTCTVAGSYDSVVYCTECTAEISRETKTLELAEHTAGEVVVENEVAATCTAEGSYDNVVYCTVCGAELSRETIEIPMLPGVAKVGDTNYGSLAEAVAAAESGATVTLLTDAIGAGVVIDKSVTIDFDGKTYTLNKAVGSAGTETLGFQILKGHNVTLKNGTLTSAAVTEGKEVKVLIQNYSNLTLTDMNLVDSTEYILYALSNNSGNIALNGATSIYTEAVAFDVYDYSAAGYAVPTMSVNTTGTIEGTIEVSETATLAISGGTFTVELDQKWCAEGFTPAKVGETYTVGKLPNAEVINLGYVTVDEYRIYNGSLTEGGEPIDLQVAMQFLAKDTAAEAAANAFGNYTTDFYITIDGIEGDSFVADGCYLAGHYGDFGWIMIPLDGMTIVDGAVYPVITSVGFDFKYVDICTSVKDFKCGIYFSDEVIKNNPDMKVNLTLGLSEDINAAREADFITVDEPYIYEVKDMLRVAEVNGVKYATLAEAVAAAESGATVTLLTDAIGAGVVIDKSVTIDFDGKTYTLNKAVGSAGTETLGFQILKGHNVTLKNGTLTSTAVTEGKEVKVLIQNYSNLTLTDMNLVDNTEHILYALSNNSGNIELNGATNITTDAVAFDVYDYSSAGYAVPSMSVNTTGTITGKIEVSEIATLAISGGTFTVELDQKWCAEGYGPTDNGDGTYGVHEHDYDAGVVTAPTCTEEGYTTYTCQNEGCDHSYVDAQVAALGHTGGEAVIENKVAATCKAEGSYDEVIKCSVCDEELSRNSKTIDKLPHTYGEPEWEWTGDDDNGYTVATAAFTCIECDGVQTVKDENLNVETTEATTEAAGKTVYTAIVTFNDKEYTDSKTVVIPKVEEAPAYSVKNNTNGTAAYSISGTTMNVQNKLACVVLVEHADGNYTPIKATANSAGGYDFDISEVKADESIVIAVKGDVNGDGGVTTADVGMLNASVLEWLTISSLKSMCGDINGVGGVTTADVGMLNAVVLEYITLSW